MMLCCCAWSAHYRQDITGPTSVAPTHVTFCGTAQLDLIALQPAKRWLGPSGSHHLACSLRLRRHHINALKWSSVSLRHGQKQQGCKCGGRHAARAHEQAEASTHRPPRPPLPPSLKMEVSDLKREQNEELDSRQRMRMSPSEDAERAPGSTVGPVEEFESFFAIEFKARAGY
ncbi:hypothetical protein L1887_43394 [Cichorium endivia]|nr:hypothetical protein L1887_43394 [Cichorium endivia]